MKKRHHVAVQMEKEQQYKIDNGPIDMTVDQLWKDSEEVEEVSSDLYKGTLARNLKATQAPLKCRKQYHKEYWQKYKLK